LSDPKVDDVRDLEVQELACGGDVAAGCDHRSHSDPLLMGIRQTGEHGVDAAVQLVPVGVQIHQPHRHDLVEVRGRLSRWPRNSSSPRPNRR
jgi:hypothetical protein